jgi:hypothetical protein
LAGGADAQQHANDGLPTVVITPASASFEEEHTAIIRPGVFDGVSGAQMAQAGLRCMNHTHVGEIFSSRSVEYWGSR